MAHKGNRVMRRRIINAYLTSVISISLVLLLIGIAALLIVNAGTVSRYFKENMQISVLMKPDVTEDQAKEYSISTSRLPYVNNTKLITREEGTEELKAMLGEDFLSVFETSPVPVSVDVTLHAEYVVADSLDFVLNTLGASPLVEEVECQQNLVDALNANMAKISLVFGVLIFLLLFISFALINNTVRVNLYARRFTIHTMKLVGATRSFIRAPFVKRAFVQGIVSSAIAVLAILGLLYALHRSFPELFTIIDRKAVMMVAGIVVACGVLICLASTYFVINKLVSSTKDELYY